MKTRDDFEGWLMFMDDTIRQLLDELPPAVSRQLDFTLDSLSTLESWLLNKYPSTEAVLQPSENWFLDRISRYVGETIRRNAGGEWDIDTKNKADVYYRLPVVKKEGKWIECPASLVTAAADRRQGDYIQTIVQSLTKQ